MSDVLNRDNGYSDSGDHNKEDHKHHHNHYNDNCHVCGGRG